LTLPDLPTTSISIIINPKIGIQILKSLYPIDSRRTRSSGPKSIWFQPGAESEEIKQYVKEMGLEGKVVCNGECILEEGDDVLRKRSASGGDSRL
jgi:predicted CoA-binding protein